jgi:hypothetical protein
MLIKVGLALCSTIFGGRFVKSSVKAFVDSLAVMPKAILKSEVCHIWQLGLFFGYALEENK